MKCLALILLLPGAALSQQTVSREEALDLAGNVHVIFERKCNECHGSHLAKPDGRFGYVLDLRRIAENLDYVVPGKAWESEIYRLVDEGEMPPDDHPKTPPLTAEEKDVVRRWIQAGSPHELPAELPKRLFTEPAPAKSAANAGLRLTRISLDLRDHPASAVFAEVGRLSGVTIDYSAPANEPRLSITIEAGTAAETLEYLALCGNFALRWNGDTAVLRPHKVVAPSKPPAKP